MENLLFTCLHDKHLSLGAQMSPFAGFDMPIQYSSIIDEHIAVRTRSGMFDVSHMGEIFVGGPDAQHFVNHVFTNDVKDMPDGKVLYGMMLYPNGGVVDDLLVYKEHGTERFLLVVNAANVAKDYEWLLSNRQGFDVTVENKSEEWAEIALQGPDSERVMKEVLKRPDAAGLSFYTYAESSWNDDRMIVSRTGYTGEDGFEIYSSTEAICAIWDLLKDNGVVPCGLGCRDTLRFEAGLPLYGHELACDITPLEASLGMFVKTDKEDFIGKDAIVAQKAAGTTRKLVGIELDGKAVARSGYPVEVNGVQVGTVTTGYHSISIDRSVCVALLDKSYTELGTRVEIVIRKKKFSGTVCRKRFYASRYKK